MLSFGPGAHAENCTSCNSGVSAAHSCVSCGKKVHGIFPCSVPLDEDKLSYGQQRICAACQGLPGSQVPGKYLCLLM